MIDLDEYSLGEPQYTHTTFDIYEPTIWAHERDARDLNDGREDIEPLNDPLTQSIGRVLAEKNVWLTATHHIAIPAVNVEKSVNVDVYIGSEDAVAEAAIDETGA